VAKGANGRQRRYARTGQKRSHGTVGRWVCGYAVNAVGVGKGCGVGRVEEVPVLVSVPEGYELLAEGRRKVHGHGPTERMKQKV